MPVMSGHGAAKKPFRSWIAATRKPRSASTIETIAPRRHRASQLPPASTHAADASIAIPAPVCGPVDSW